MGDIIELGYGACYDGQEPNLEVVEVLKQYLEMAQNGEIRSLAVIGMNNHEDPFIAAVTGDCRFGPMFGALKILEIELTDRFRICADMQELKPGA